jgi:hypothetical protein
MVPPRPTFEFEDRDHPLVMRYEMGREWLDPVRHILPRGPSRHERAQAQLLAAAIHKAQTRIPSISYSRRRAYYATRRGRRYDQYPDLCTYDLIVPNVDLLSDVGLLDNEVAAADPTSGRQSTFRPTPALIEVLGNTPPPAAKWKPRALVQLRDTEKQPIDYPDTDQTDRWRRRLLDINEMVDSVIIRFPPDVGENRGDLLIIGDSIANLGNTALYRIFNETFRKGGRFYGHWVQGLPKKIRKLLTINSERVAEPDYKAHHLRILYGRAGLLPPDDPYDLDGWERNIVKMALLIMINAPSPQKVRGAITHHLRLDPNDARRLVQDLERRHAPIAEHFQSGAGCWLQRLDSDMAEIVLLGLTKKGIPAVPIHDSFVTPVRHRAVVVDRMEEALHRVIYGCRGAPNISAQKQRFTSNPFHIMVEVAGSFPSLSVPLPPSPLPLSSPSSVAVGAPSFFDDLHRITKIGRRAILDAKRQRDIRQDTLADLVGISRPHLANILAGRFGTSPEVTERVTWMVLTTREHERQPFLPGLAA